MVNRLTSEIFFRVPYAYELMSIETLNKIVKIKKTFSYQNQCNKYREELIEFENALLNYHMNDKVVFGNYDSNLEEEVVYEIADCIITSLQVNTYDFTMQYILRNLDYHNVSIVKLLDISRLSKAITYKVERTLRYIKEGKYEIR